MTLKTIHIFKAGTHTAMSGQEISFSDYDLMRAAAAYNPKLHVAPLVLGHPATDDPAYGAVQRLSAKGSDLFADSTVSDKLSKMVQDGAYLTVSSAFYAPDDRRNPSPGSWYLKHVGFLGAQPPAVKGMTPPAFAESGLVCFTESLKLTGVLSTSKGAGIAGVSFAEDREGFHRATNALMSATPGMSYAEAAGEIHRRHQWDQTMRSVAPDAEPDRAKAHASILQLQRTDASLSYAEAANKFFAPR